MNTPNTEAQPVVMVDVAITISLFVTVPSTVATDKMALAGSARDWIEYQANNVDDDDEIAARITVMQITPVEEVTFESVAGAVRDYLRAEIAKLPEDERVDVIGLSFASGLYDNGYFFESYPDLVLRDQRQVYWHDIFSGTSRATLSKFTADLTNLSESGGERNATLVLSLDTLDEVWDVSDLFEVE